MSFEKEKLGYIFFCRQLTVYLPIISNIYIYIAPKRTSLAEQIRLNGVDLEPNIDSFNFLSSTPHRATTRMNNAYKNEHMNQIIILKLPQISTISKASSELALYTGTLHQALFHPRL